MTPTARSWNTLERDSIVIKKKFKQSPPLLPPLKGFSKVRLCASGVTSRMGNIKEERGRKETWQEKKEKKKEQKKEGMKEGKKERQKVKREERKEGNDNERENLVKKQSPIHEIGLKYRLNKKIP